jgi:phosphoribosylformylglycinamidine cyclo-ligase
MIQEAAGTQWREMYQVFNMGQRLEVYTTPEAANDMIALSSQLGIDAVVSGYVKASVKNELIIESPYGVFTYP